MTATEIILCHYDDHDGGSMIDILTASNTVCPMLISAFKSLLDAFSVTYS